MKYKAVIFDLFGTLVYNSNWSEQTIVLERMATMLSVPSDDFKNLWRDTFDERMKDITELLPLLGSNVAPL